VIQTPALDGKLNTGLANFGNRWKMVKKTYVMSCYLSLKRHPQAGDPQGGIGGLIPFGKRAGHVKANNANYCSPWIQSLSNFDVVPVIFHDNLTEGFVNRQLELSNKVKFVKVDIGPYSNNDQRFFYYKEFIEKVGTQNVKNVFTTDLWDVLCKKDPSKLDIEDGKLFFCEDNPLLNKYNFNGVKFDTVHKSENWTNLNTILSKNFKLLNAGVIGGNAHTFYNFLEIFTEIRKKSHHSKLVRSRCKNNINMFLVNYIARNFFTSVESGYPFCSDYKQYQTYRDDVYFCHK